MGLWAFMHVFRTVACDPGRQRNLLRPFLTDVLLPGSPRIHAPIQSQQIVFDCGKINSEMLIKSKRLNIPKYVIECVV